MQLKNITGNLVLEETICAIYLIFDLLCLADNSKTVEFYICWSATECDRVAATGVANITLKSSLETGGYS